MEKSTLVIMAAGMGSRYGGLKQIDPIGPNGEVIIHYSIYDALKAGFEKIVFIINDEIKETFKSIIGDRIDKFIETDYIFQRLDDLPYGFSVPDGRIKPWGTAHAVFCCRDAVNTPFAVINSDDFYGPSSFKVLHDYLIKTKDKENFYDYSMVGFMIENTLTENGSVSRGVCTVDKHGYLKEIHERTKIKKIGNDIKYTEDEITWFDIPKGSIVSMNMWGFIPSIFDEIEAGFSVFMKENSNKILNAEYYLPSVVNSLIKGHNAKVKVLTTKEQWYGVTYKEDKPKVKEAIEKLIDNGVYPERLF